MSIPNLITIHPIIVDIFQSGADIVEQQINRRTFTSLELKIFEIMMYEGKDLLLHCLAKVIF